MTMRVRKVSATGDMIFGRSQADFWHNQPEGVAQVAVTRLRLELGEWFLDTSDGTAWRTQVLGKGTDGTRDAVIRTRILGTPDVLSILEYGSVLDRGTRRFVSTVKIETPYGVGTISDRNL